LYAVIAIVLMSPTSKLNGLEFKRSYRESEVFSLPSKLSEIVPLNFGGDEPLPAGVSSLLEIAVISPHIGHPRPGNTHWTIDGQEYGSGHRIWVRLDEGQHELRISLEWNGRVAVEKTLLLRAEHRASKL